MDRCEFKAFDSCRVLNESPSTRVKVLTGYECFVLWDVSYDLGRGLEWGWGCSSGSPMIVISFHFLSCIAFYNLWALLIVHYMRPNHIMMSC